MIHIWFIIIKNRERSISVYPLCHFLSTQRSGILIGLIACTSQQINCFFRYFIKIYIKGDLLGVPFLHFFLKEFWGALKVRLVVEVDDDCLLANFWTDFSRMPSELRSLTPSSFDSSPCFSSPLDKHTYVLEEVVTLFSFIYISKARKRLILNKNSYFALDWTKLGRWKQIWPPTGFTLIATSSMIVLLLTLSLSYINNSLRINYVTLYIRCIQQLTYLYNLNSHLIWGFVHLMKLEGRPTKGKTKIIMIYEATTTKLK